MAQPKQTKSMKRKKLLRTIVTVIAVIILILTAAVFYFQRMVTKRFAKESTQNVIETVVSTGSIRTTVSGTGTLESEDVLDITLPSGVEIKRMAVETGDSVEEGDLLAVLEERTVRDQLTQVRDKLSELDDSLQDAAEDQASSRVRTPVSGRLKVLYAQEGDDVAAVMYAHGALALVSLDGYMSCEITGTYDPGTILSGTNAAGETLEGTVDSSRNGTTVVLFPDDMVAYGETISLEGQSVAAQIHKSLAITGYTGTVNRVQQKLDAKLYADSIIFQLKDTKTAARYDGILAERKEYEDLYAQLVKLSRDGGLLAPCAGRITTIAGEETAADTAAAYAGLTSTASVTTTSGSLLSETDVLTLDPCQKMSVTISVDETDILSLSLGQQVNVTVDSIGTETYVGTVTQVDTTATSASGVTSYACQITLDRAENMLPGMTASAEVTIQGVENAMLLPADALNRTAGTYYVYTTYDEENDTLGGMVEVTIGMTNGTETEITSGIGHGQTVFYKEKQQTFKFGNFTFNMEPGSMAPMGGGMSGMGGMNGGGRRG